MSWDATCPAGCRTRYGSAASPRPLRSAPWPWRSGAQAWRAIRARGAEMGAAATRTPDAVIEVSGLSREFTVAGRGLRRERRTVTAVRDLSFAIERGEMVGYIGP